MNIDEYKRIIEAAIFAADEPLSLTRIKNLFSDEEDLSKSDANKIIELIAADYQNKAIELKEVASGYRFQIRKDYADYVKKLWQERTPRYSRALLETLSLIAYRQPITRAEIEDIRGVAVNSNIIKTLMEREWVRVIGHREVPGRPELLATTKQFLDYFDLKTLEELPTLAALQDITKTDERLQLDLVDNTSEHFKPDAKGDKEAIMDQDFDVAVEESTV